ncbi:S1 RNA-binding domain-containing protein, partial [Proteus mirabilis]|uniref:S1 RNA-binding domain-containing protein n=1 Tax=Proteus mirabilis TaxID=584 RepID=UPI001EF46607
IGVHQDGLVHISSLSDRFVEDPHTVVKTGDIVKVKVLEVDLPEAYPIVENILQSIHQKIDQVMGNSALLSQINAREFVTEQFG